MYKLRRLCEQPALYLFDDFLSEAECEHLIELAQDHLQASAVVDIHTGESVQNDYRQSFNTFLNRGTTDIVHSIEGRISELVEKPIENGEDFQLLKYEIGGYYKPHYDYFDPEYEGNRKRLVRGGQRVATFLIYLNDVEEGGETYFPEIGIKIVPKKGRAILWWNTFNDLKLDPDTKHSSEPVLKGTKWVATKWIHENEFK